jgi:hypothetical protein
MLCVDVHMRKKRNVSSVMGWLLSFQLSDPGAGVCWAVSMVCSRSRRMWCGSFGGELHVAFAAAAQERAPASRRLRELWSQRAFPARHRLFTAPRARGAGMVSMSNWASRDTQYSFANLQAVFGHVQAQDGDSNYTQGVHVRYNPLTIESCSFPVTTKIANKARSSLFLKKNAREILCHDRRQCNVRPRR